MAKDRQWLKQRLCGVLGWDEVVVEGVVEAITSAETAKEVEAIVQVALKIQALSFSPHSKYVHRPKFSNFQDYMGGGAQPKQLVQDFLQAQGKSFAAAGSNQNTGGVSSLQAQPTVPSKHNAEVHGQHSKKGVKEAQRQGGALTIKHTTARKGKGPPGGARGGPPGSDLERKVVNCLCCGKVYDFRLAGAGQLTNDLLRFLEHGGICTFCGAQLALSYSEHSQTNQPNPPALPPPATPAHTPHLPKAGAAAAQPSSSSSAQSAVDMEADVVDKEADAVAFKNRLVGYDRNAAQRTKVIDDQSDYFEIDSNTWLSDQERNELKARARDEAAAQEARKNKVTITVDLLGRQVLMSDSPEARQLEASQSATPSTASSAQQSASELPSTSSSSTAAAAPSGPTPQSGSHALRIASNPNLSGPAPMFVKQPMQQLADVSDASPSTDGGPEQRNTSSSRTRGGRVNGNMQQLQAEGQHHPAGKADARSSARQAKLPSRKQTNRPPRLQHDDPFLAYDVVVA
ncbi:TPA: hypothetical protein ACH3X2_008016 [Trebouxia sp. C0005]